MKSEERDWLCVSSSLDAWALILSLEYSQGWSINQRCWGMLQQRWARQNSKDFELFFIRWSYIRRLLASDINRWLQVNSKSMWCERSLSKIQNSKLCQIEHSWRNQRINFNQRTSGGL